jgi:hypothetical protein
MLWSNKPARGPLERLDIRGGHEVSAIQDLVERGDLGVSDVEDPARLVRVLAWVDHGIVRLARPGATPPGAAAGRRFVGLQTRAPRS